MMSGLLDFVELHPGQTPTTFHERGILYTFYQGRDQFPGPAPIVMLLSPVLATTNGQRLTVTSSAHTAPTP